MGENEFPLYGIFANDNIFFVNLILKRGRTARCISRTDHDWSIEWHKVVENAQCNLSFPSVVRFHGMNLRVGGNKYPGT